MRNHDPGVDRSGAVLLVRNPVEHDARVLRCARVAARLGPVLVVGVATDTAPSGRLEIDGVAVLRLPARGWLLNAASAVGAVVRRPPAARTGARAATAAGAGSGAAGSRPLSPGERARRALIGLSWTARATRAVLRARPAVVHANDWNTMWAGLAAKLIGGSALVYDSHELWADRNGRWEWRPWLIACEWLFVQLADAVIVTSPGHSEALAQRYRIPTPCVVRNLPAGSWPAATAVEHEPTLAYVGGLMPGRGLEQAIDALPLLPGVRLRAIGPGARSYRQALRDRAVLRGVSNRVELCDPVAPGDVVDAVAGAALGLCLIQPVCRSYELALPNKLFEYVAAGLPVLCSDLPVIAAVVRQGGLGEVVAHSDPAQIAAGARRLLEPGEARASRAARVNAFAGANRWEREAEILARIYAQATGDTAAVRP